MIFTDVHSHILWGVDDGIKTKDDAIRCLEKAKSDGIGRIFVTPHVIPGKTDSDDISEMELRFTELKQIAEDYEIELYRGCELLINRYANEWLSNNLFIFMGDSRYLLCEFDPRRDVDDLDGAEDMLYEITLRNIVPVIAHAERAFHKKVDIDRVREWIDMGCVIQINRTSIMGLHGKTAKSNAFRLIDNGLCHLIGSDVHEAEGIRTAELSDSFDVISKKYTEQSAKILFTDNPQSLVEDREMQQIHIKKKYNFFR